MRYIIFRQPLPRYPSQPLPFGLRGYAHRCPTLAGSPRAAVRRTGTVDPTTPLHRPLPDKGRSECLSTADPENQVSTSAPVPNPYRRSKTAWKVEKCHLSLFVADAQKDISESAKRRVSGPPGSSHLDPSRSLFRSAE